jgi:hypothetical protein
MASWIIVLTRKTHHDIQTQCAMTMPRPLSVGLWFHGHQVLVVSLFRRIYDEEIFMAATRQI